MVAWLSRVIPLLEAKAGFARIALGYATDSVLLWDEAEQRYDEETTPGYGSQTLQGVYTRVLREGVVPTDSADAPYPLEVAAS